MHQIRFRLGLHPRPAGGARGAHSAPPDHLDGFEGVLLLREGKGMGGKGEGEEKEERGKRREGRREGGGRKERGEGCIMAFGRWTPLLLHRITRDLVLLKRNCLLVQE